MFALYPFLLGMPGDETGTPNGEYEQAMPVIILSHQDEESSFVLKDRGVTSMSEEREVTSMSEEREVTSMSEERKVTFISEEGEVISMSKEEECNFEGGKILLSQGVKIMPLFQIWRELVLR